MARRARGPATQAVVAAVRDALNRWAPGDSPLLVACSGGADSLALAAATVAVAGTVGRRLSGVCVDHGLQPGSAAGAATVVRQLGGLGLTARVAAVRVDPEHGGGPEAAARDARYRVLDDLAAADGAVVLLGHTRDDQAESVLLGLARGAGTRSIAAMAPRRDRFVRPLLDLPRVVTAGCCVELGLSPWADPHNSDHRYARVRARERVLPVLEAELGPGIAAALARTAALARDDADLLDELAVAADPGGEQLGVAEVAGLPTALRSRVLRRWLARAGAGEIGLTHVRAVERLVTDWHGQQGVQVPGLTVRRVAGRLVAGRAGEVQPVASDVQG